MMDPLDGLAVSTDANNLPLVRGGKIPPGALRFLAEVKRLFPSTMKDIILVRKPNSFTARRRNR